MIILIIGLPGSGKTTLARALLDNPICQNILIDGDAVREDLSMDLDFSDEDRIEQARRIGAVCRLVNTMHHHVIAAFVCPTTATRKAFGTPDVTIWLDTIKTSQHPSTDAIWEDPLHYDIRLPPGLTVEKQLMLVRGVL